MNAFFPPIVPDFASPAVAVVDVNAPAIAPASAAEPARSAADVAVSLSGIRKVYPARKTSAEVVALDDVDLTVGKGRIVGVIGPSGAGKSTLIRLVNGLERPSSGRIVLHGKDVTGRTEAQWRQARREIGMIFQHFNLLSSRTVFDNIAMPLEIAGASRSDIAQRVDRLIELVGLTDKRGRYPSELSGGQKQRVGIARALATEPSILLCDEATSALDPETTRSILSLIRQINRELGVTVLLITHEIPVIKEICDDVAVIEAGRIVEQGPVFDVFTKPSHPVTRRFVEGVTQVEVPARIAAGLTQEPHEAGQAVLRIGFVGEHATAPVISRLSALIGADVNILAGRIDEIAGQPFGSLLVAIPNRNGAVEAAGASFTRLGLGVERVGYLSADDRSNGEGARDVA